MSLIVAFGYKSRRGKDTAARYLVQMLRASNEYPRVVKVGFADRLKAAAHLIWGCYGLREGEHYETLEGQKERTVKLADGLDPVEHWVALGQKVREIAAPTWRDAALAKAKDCDALVISDLRFPNEVEGIKELGGHVIQVVNPRVTEERGSDKFLDDFNAWDHVINNDGSLRELYDKVLAMCQHHGWLK